MYTKPMHIETSSDIDFLVRKPLIIGIISYSNYNEWTINMPKLILLQPLDIIQFIP